MAMDVYSRTTFTSDGQRWEIDVLMHMMLYYFRRSPFILFFISFVSNHMCGLCVALW
jgi:hypothetical protein